MILINDIARLLIFITVFSIVLSCEKTISVKLPLPEEKIVIDVNGDIFEFNN